MSFKCVIIDDEQYAIDALVSYIAQMSNLSLVASFTNPVEALQQINTIPEIDFIFLDIEMPHLSGLELATSLRDKTQFLVFTTGHTDYAIKAYDLQANHYLLKPITFSKFALTINEILQKSQSTGQLATLGQPKLQFIKGDQKNAYHCIDSDMISYISAVKNYAMIHTKDNEQFLTHLGLTQIAGMLDPIYFIRVNKSYIVAKAAIKKVEGNTIRLKNDKEVPLGAVHKAAFHAFLNEHMLT